MDDIEPSLDCSDEWLVKLVQSRQPNVSRQAMGILYQKHWRDVWLWVRKRVEISEDADDITMDTWIYAVKNIDKFVWGEGEGNKLKAWLFSIANYKRLEFLRAHPNEDPLEASLNSIVHANSKYEGSDEQTEHLSNIAQRELDRVMQEAMMDLPDTQRHILILLFYGVAENASEVGHLLGIPAVTVRVYRKRALKNLRESPVLQKHWKSR